LKISSYPCADAGGNENDWPLADPVNHGERVLEPVLELDGDLLAGGKPDTFLVVSGIKMIF
jgi:hypothetical protein